MRQVVIRRTLRLAREGYSLKDIADEVVLTQKRVREVLAEHQAGLASGEPPTEPSVLPPEVKSLSDAARTNRSALLKSIEFYARQLEKLDRLAEALLPDEEEIDLSRVKPGLVHTITVTRAITLDKQAEALRQLRALESEGSEVLEMRFTIIEVDEEGHRRIVGEPPELARWHRGEV